MVKRLACQNCGKRHKTYATSLKCQRSQPIHEIQLSIDSSESQSENSQLSVIEKTLQESNLRLRRSNVEINKIVIEQNYLKKKIYKNQLKRKKKQQKLFKNIQMVQSFEKQEKLDLDSLRIMVKTYKLQILSKKMRLSCTLPKHRDSECKNWFQIIDEPFYLSVPPDKKLKFLENLPKYCCFQESFSFVSRKSVWIDVEKLKDCLFDSRITFVRLNTHGLKTYNFGWVEEIIFADSRNSFDFGIYSESIPKNFVFTSFLGVENVPVNCEYFPILGYENFGGQQFQIGFEQIQVKIYSTLVHHLKYKCNSTWNIPQKMTYKVLRNRLQSIKEFVQNIDEKQSFPIRLEITVRQKVRLNKFQRFSEIIQKAVAHLKILSIKFDSMNKIKVPIFVYKNDVLEKIQVFQQRLKRNEKQVEKQVVDQFAFLLNCAGWYHYFIKNRIQRFLRKDCFKFGELLI